MDIKQMMSCPEISLPKRQGFLQHVQRFLAYTAFELARLAKLVSASLRIYEVQHGLTTAPPRLPYLL
jgi:hypothetical protein